MAIIKELDTKFGIKASYHRITAFNISYKHKKVVMCVGTYLSKEARKNKKEPIEEIDIEVPYSDFGRFLDVNPIKESYKWLKENVDGFDKATDDFERLEVLPKVIVDPEVDE